MNEEEFLKKLKEGDELTWGDFYKANAAGIFAHLLRYGCSHLDAEELCNDTFSEFKIILTKNKYKHKGTLNAFLKRIALNQFFKKIRSHKNKFNKTDAELEYIRRNHEELDLPKYFDSITKPLSPKELIVRECWNSIGELCKRLFDAIYEKGLDNKALEKLFDFTPRELAIQKYACNKKLITCAKKKGLFKK